LAELVKCKISKSIIPPKTPVRPDIYNLIAGFQRLCPDMSGLSALSGLVAGFQRHFLDMSDPQIGHV
jgi:hypothetical protein